ncbi:hypothetical protein IEN85_09835 [Pelagicoccus sp. NFK12]|uniref:Ig-like domain-containing protein n=1 Tax=Pelagicoccus enzymogenes TaxID=2773457 RepID=A0A927F7A8_9BACT|nr:Ig-like domain-containing protein [Pelagicoccus enzymogenes]MBD5779792.1 hypothetical protein [Pelagicoccus enzymogenes]
MSDSIEIPSQRPLKRPYFLLRTSDGRNHYFRYEIVRAVFHSTDPISRFLPRAEVVGKPDARAPSDQQEPALVYDFSELDLEDPAPLKYISDAEIEAFTAAVDAFLLRDANAATVSSYERELREHFRLPDPVKEKDAYWTYGPKKDRKLLILHGVEYEPETSVTLDTVISHLERNCRLPWGLAQDRVIERIQETGEPLSKFVARPTSNGFLVAGKRIPIEDTKPAKRFPPKLASAFRAAAEDFYRRAHDGNCSSNSEREWRSQFKLPDPKYSQNAYFLCKQDGQTSLLVSLSEKEKEENCIHLCEDPKIPATLNDQPTVASRLASLKPSIWIPVGIAAAGVALIGALATFIANRDTVGPTLDTSIGDNGIVALDDDTPSGPYTITLNFTETIDPGSLLNEAGESNLEVREDRSNVQWALAEVPELVGENQNQIRLTLARSMQEGTDYLVIAKNLSDLKGNITQEIETEFEFDDKLPPAINPERKPTAEGASARMVRIFFTDSLDERSVNDTRNYHIEPIVLAGSADGETKPLTIRDASYNKEDNSITLSVEADQNPFKESREYRATISGIEDTAGNEVDDDAPLIVRFSYVDTLAPKVEDVVANSSQYEIKIRFNESVQPDLSRIDDYLRFEDRNGNRIAIRRANLESANEVIAVETDAALRNGITYTAYVKDVPDRAINPNLLESETRLDFDFVGQSDLEGPSLVEASALSTRLLLTYSEAIDRRITNSDQFGRFVLEDEHQKRYEIAQAEIRDDKPNVLRLQTVELMPDDTQFTITTPGVTDNTRNKGNDKDLSLSFASRTMAGPIELQQAVYDPTTSNVLVKFNRRPTAAVLDSPHWFEFQPELEVKSISVSPDNPRELMVEVGELSPDAPYYQLNVSAELTALDESKPIKTLSTRFNERSGY